LQQRPPLGAASAPVEPMRWFTTWVLQ
jgi:hypothetical protein